MASSAHDETGPGAEDIHTTSWSVDLEGPRYAGDRSLVVEDALAAIEATASGRHVNLVSHGDCGHPETYLLPALEEAYGDEFEWDYVEQCGCGGHVTRVYV